MQNNHMSPHGGDIYRNEVNYDFSVNINPLGAPAPVINALQNPEKWCVNYPDPDNHALTVGLQKALHIPDSQFPRDQHTINVLWGNGASELISTAINCLRPYEVWQFIPAFSGYARAAEAFGAALRNVPLKREADFSLDEDAVSRFEVALALDQRKFCEAALDQQNPNLLILTDPGNPTGQCIRPEILHHLCAIASKYHMYILLDGCFRFLSGRPDLKDTYALLEQYPNLLYLSAFTKTFAIPGLRLGYLLTANTELAAQLRNLLPEWNISVPAQRAGQAILKPENAEEMQIYLKQSQELIQTERRRLSEELTDMGVHVTRSDANFLLFYVNESRPGSMYHKLLQKGILIRDCQNYQGLAPGDYRVAVKTADENRKLLQSISGVLNEQTMFCCDE